MPLIRAPFAVLILLAATLVSPACGKKVDTKPCYTALYEPHDAASPRVSGTNSREKESECVAECDQTVALCAKGGKAAVQCEFDGRVLRNRKDAFDCK